MGNLDNKKILISGVGKGLGQEMMLECLNQGAEVYGFTRSIKDIENLKKKKISNLKIFNGDANDQKFIDQMFVYFKKNKIMLNGLINNAGIRQRKNFLEFTSKDLKYVLDTNFIAPFFLTQKFIKQLSKKSLGSVVNIGSIVGEKPFKQLIGYASAKSALSAMTKSLSLELLDNNYKVRINCINPGFTKTSYFKKFSKNKKLYSWTLKNISLKRWAHSSEISKLAIFLLSKKSSYITGEVINIDGGWKY